MMRLLVVVLISLFLTACGSGGYGTSYRAYENPALNAELVGLAEEQEPYLLHSTDLRNDVQMYKEHNYVVVGESAFNGTKESTSNAIRQAKEIGATHVIVTSNYTDTKSYLAYDYQDHYRTVYVNKVKYIDGKPHAYTKAVTVRDTVAVPYTRYYDNYDQAAVYLVKSTRHHKLGLKLRDLSPYDRNKYGRNTGAFIDVVMKNSPAFMANIVATDILVGINGERVQNTFHANQMIDGLERNGDTIILSVLHQGKQMNITMEYHENPGAVNGMPEARKMPLIEEIPDIDVIPDDEQIPNGADNPQNGPSNEWINPDRTALPPSNVKAKSISF